MNFQLKTLVVLGMMLQAGTRAQASPWSNDDRVKNQKNSLFQNATFLMFPRRCEIDNLEDVQAKGRNKWSERCLSDREDVSFSVPLKALSAFSKASHTAYLTFGYRDETGRLRPGNYRAPVFEDAPCDLPSDYVVTAVCLAGCFASGEELSFPGGVDSLDQVSRESNPFIMGMKAGSIRGRLEYAPQSVNYYLSSDYDHKEQLIHFYLVNGAELRVTRNHPVLKADGYMQRADAFRAGDSVVVESGEAVKVKEIQSESYFGKVHNVALDSQNLQENILIANGILTGSVFYQNEGEIYLKNKQLERQLLPASLLTAE